METNKINQPLILIKEFGHPFIEGFFKSKTGDFLKGLFIIDTGADVNILNYGASKLLSDEAITEEKKQVSGLDENGKNFTVANVEIAVGEDISCESFTLSPNMDFERFYGPNKIIGLLGTEYLQEHHLALDYDTECLRMVEEDKVPIESTSYYFPMNFGINYYGNPVVCAVKNNVEYLLLVDSGANQSGIVENALELATKATIHEECDKERTVKGVDGEENVIFAEIDFTLLNMRDNNGMCEAFDVHDSIMIFPERDYMLPSPDGEVLPVVGVLSSEFMLEHKWILDFANGTIYSKRET